MENWIELMGYNGKYSFSDLGRIKIISKKGVEKITNGYISKTNGYYKIGLYSNGKTKTYEVHVLIAFCFLNHKANGLKLVVDHIDNNKLNNKLDNLQITSQRINTRKDRINKNNIVGIKKKENNKFEAGIKINGKKIYLGLFKTDIEAGNIYRKANENINIYNGDSKYFRNYLLNIQ